LSGVSYPLDLNILVFIRGTAKTFAVHLPPLFYTRPGQED